MKFEYLMKHLSNKQIIYKITKTFMKEQIM